jgi:hypothetical protein
MMHMNRYFSAASIGDTLFPAFKGVLGSPNDYFTAMPAARDYRDSFMLLCIFLSVPALVASLLTGVISIIFILPISLMFGLIGTWMWAWYLGWAARHFCASDLTTVNAFQICAYSSAPLVFSWIPLVGLLGWLWNLYLIWQGLVSQARLGAGPAMLIILGAFFVMSLSLFTLLALLLYAGSQFGVEMPPAPTWF